MVSGVLSPLRYDRYDYTRVLETIKTREVVTQRTHGFVPHHDNRSCTCSSRNYVVM